MCGPCCPIARGGGWGWLLEADDCPSVVAHIVALLLLPILEVRLQVRAGHLLKERQLPGANFKQRLHDELQEPDLALSNRVPPFFSGPVLPSENKNSTRTNAVHVTEARSTSVRTGAYTYTPLAMRARPGTLRPLHLVQKSAWVDTDARGHTRCAHMRHTHTPDAPPPPPPPPPPPRRARAKYDAKQAEAVTET